MAFHLPYFGWRPRYRDEDYAEMRDQLIEARTQVVLLGNVIEHQRRPLRAPRKDSHIIIARKAETTRRLEAAVQGRGQQ